jgi:hypothetical protein
MRRDSNHFVGRDRPDRSFFLWWEPNPNGRMLSKEALKIKLKKVSTNAALRDW